MGRNRVVEPGIVRLELADVYRRAHTKLLTKGVEVKDQQWRQATAEEVASSEAALAAAIEDKDWIEVKRMLSAGENRDAFNKLVKPMEFNQKAKVEVKQIGLSKIVAYLVRWSLCGPNDQALPYNLEMPEEEREATVLSLDQWTYGELDAAIDWHEEENTRAREARKNDRGGETRSSTTLPSVA